MRELLVVALVLACPLMMVFMMRGGHGHGGQSGGCHGGQGDGNEAANVSAEELRRRRSDLDRQIAEAEDAERRELEESRWARR